MNRRKRVAIITELPVNKPYSALVLGPAAIIPAALRRIECAWQWDHGLRGFLVPRQHLADVEAVLVADGHDVQARMGMLGDA